MFNKINMHGRNELNHCRDGSIFRDGRKNIK
jgi:hypothetical protein